MPYDVPPRSHLSRLSDDLRAVVARVSPSIVSLRHRRGAGSGFVLTPDGLVLTNHHVIQGAGGGRGGAGGGLGVGLAGRAAEWPAAVVGRDAATDLAVLRIPASGLPALPLVGRDAVSIGQIVLAIGNPLRFERSVSLGVVSAMDRSLPASGGALHEGLIQTDAAINPGNSGGPLVDAEGAVVGINTAMIPYAQGLGFAVPARTATWVAAVLIRDGAVQRPHFGIAARGIDLPAETAAALGQGRAVLVSGVGPGTPAAAAGLRADDLILSAAGAPVAWIDDLQRICVLGRLREVELSVWRRERRLALAVKLA